MKDCELRNSADKKLSSFHSNYLRHRGTSSAFMDFFCLRLFAFVAFIWVSFETLRNYLLRENRFCDILSSQGFLFALHQLNVCRWDFVWSFRYRVPSKHDFLPFFNHTAKSDEWNWLMELRVINDTEKSKNLFDVFALTGPRMVFCYREKFRFPNGFSVNWKISWKVV